MKIGIIGDVHLGASLSLSKKDSESTIMPSRLEDYGLTLRFTIKDLADKGCKYIVFTGDIFEHRLPTIQQQECFSAALAYALSLGILKIIICVGNHDQLRTISSTNLSYLKALELEKIQVCDEIELIKLLNDAGEVCANLIILPYRDRRWFGVPKNSEALELLEQEFAYALGSIDNTAPKLVVGHMTIEGTLWMVEEYAELYNGNELVLPVSMFDQINITVMGHVHTPGLISKKPLIAYVGSMEKRGGFENHDKKYLVIDLETKKLSEFTEPCREIYDINMSFVEKTIGEGVTKEIIKNVDKFAEGKNLEGSIIRFGLTIQASDDKYCDTAEIVEHLLSKYKISHCLDIKPTIAFSRQVRDEKINERTSDVEAYKRFIENEFMDHPLKEDILENGLEFFGYGVEQ